MSAAATCDVSNCHIKYVHVCNGLPLTNIHVLSTLTHLADNLQPHSCAECLAILGASTSWGPKGLSRLLQRLLHKLYTDLLMCYIFFKTCHKQKRNYLHLLQLHCKYFYTTRHAKRNVYSFQHLSRMLQATANLALPGDCMTVIQTSNFILPLITRVQTTAQFP